MTTPTSSRAAVVPAGASFRGRLGAEAVEIRGLVAGEVACGYGPLVIHEIGGLEGRATAKGDVRVAGIVTPGSAVEADLISTPGRLILLPGARVRGDVRCGTIEIHEGATLQGVARGHPGAD
jgi:cytoskeletal protein CcmA (bactofilin family)